jgi:hypothetical protein
VRPGGRLLLEDDDHDVLRLWPEPPGFAPMWAAYQRSYDRLGHDPIVGRRLVQLLHEAGAAPVRNTWVFFGSCAGHPDFDAFVDNLHGVLAGALPAMAATGLPSGVVGSALEAIGAWRTRPDAAIWYALACAEGRRP